MGLKERFMRKRTVNGTKGGEEPAMADKARRDERKAFYHKIPYCALRRLAARYLLGSDRYEKPGQKLLFEPSNWQNGDRAFFTDAYNHVIEHLYRWADGDRSEDHLAAAAWGCFALIWAEEKGIFSDTPRQERPAADPGNIFDELFGRISTTG